MPKKNKYTDWTKEELIKRITALEKRKKYGLVWDEEKTKEKFEADAEGKFPVLKDIKSKHIKKATNSQTHILIQGDNYHTLSVLSYAHERSIDFIYIDPPYNTGTKDFRFNDDYVNKDDPYKHSKWLSFMYKRLLLAKRLLTQNGVLFVSIDDNELANLKLLLDEIFPDGLIAMFIHKNNSSKNQANLASISTEYLLAYRKTKDALKGVKWKMTKRGSKDIVKMYGKLKNKGYDLNDILDEIKEMYKRPKYAHLSRWNKVDEIGVFKDADLSREGGPKDYTIINPTSKKQCAIPERGWGKSYDELLRLQKEKLIYYGDNTTPPGLKDYISSEDEIVPDTFMYFDNSVDTRMIKSIFGKLVFENPKPIEMIKTIIDMSTDDKSIILDFFAGSGTTGHAVLELNEENKAKRQFILCTNDENNICTEVCYPRISKVMQGYKNNKKQSIASLGGNLRYYKTSFVPQEPTDKNKEKLTREATEMLCLRENAFEFVSEKNGYKIYKNDKKYVGIIMEQEEIENFKKEVNKYNKPISVYIFSLSEEDFSDEFADMKNKIKVCSIPEAILKVYRRIFK